MEHLEEDMNKFTTIMKIVSNGMTYAVRKIGIDSLICVVTHLTQPSHGNQMIITHYQSNQNKDVGYNCTVPGIISQILKIYTFGNEYSALKTFCPFYIQGDSIWSYLNSILCGVNGS